MEKPKWISIYQNKNKGLSAEMSVQQKNLAVYNYFSQLQNSSVFLAGVLYNMYIILSLIEIVLEGLKIFIELAFR